MATLDAVMLQWAEVLGWLARSLAFAADEWAQPIELGEWWDRPAVPFHVVLAGERDTIDIAARRWAGAGAMPVPFGPAR